MSYRVWTNTSSLHYALIIRGRDPRSPNLEMSAISVREVSQTNAKIVDILTDWAAAHRKHCYSVKLMPITPARFEREAARSELTSAG